MQNSAHQTTDVVPEGKIIDFIDGKERKDTPEEYVRQQIERSIISEYIYEKEDCKVEFSIKMASTRKSADIVIFPPNSKQIQESIKIIFECKKEDIKSNDKKEGIEQLKSYMSSCLNAEFGFWTNSIEKFCFRKIAKENKFEYEEINDIPKFGQSLEQAEKISIAELREATGDNLKFAFRRCHDYIAGNQGLQKSEAFWELLKLIICKIYDEREGNLEFYITSDNRKTLNGQLTVKKRIDSIFSKVKDGKEFKKLFEKDRSLNLEPRVTAFIVSQLQNYSLLETNVDVKGTAYEEIVGSNLRGDRGEFFTPRNICQMTMKIINPKHNEQIIDPACGTGGFLIIAMNHVINQIKVQQKKKWKDGLNPTDNERLELFRKISEHCKNNVYGFDFNPNLVKASKLNMVMNNDGSGGLFQANSLEQHNKWQDDIRKRLEIKNSNIAKFDIVVTNPPFGTKIVVDDPVILEQFDLAHHWESDEKGNFCMKNSLRKSVPPEILFIERCIQLLKEGGRMAIVLPDAILGAPGYEYVRFWILKNAKVFASIDLDKDTFQPKNGTQTSVLCLVKKTKKELETESKSGNNIKYLTFMAMANKVGHDQRGKSVFLRDSKGKDVLEIRKEEIKETKNGKISTRIIETKHKTLDDDTHEISKLFIKWKEGKWNF